MHQPAPDTYEEGVRLGDSQIVQHLRGRFNHDRPHAVVGTIGAADMRAGPQVAGRDPATLQGEEGVRGG